MANEAENHALVADDEVPTDDYEIDLYNYKRSLSQFEARLVEFKEHKVKYCERIRILERDVEIRDNKIKYLKNELEQHGESSDSIMSKPMIKFVKEADCPRVTKINNTENARKSTVKYAEMYRNISKGKPWPKDNYAHKSMTPRAILLKPDTTPIVGNPQNNINDKGYWESGCSRHMTENISYLSKYEPYDGGYVSFGHEGGKITGKGIIKIAPTETLTPRRYTRRAMRIAQSKALSPAVDEPESLLRDDRQGEAFPTVSSLDVGQDRENIAKTSTLPHESSSRVPSLGADEGSMQESSLSRIRKEDMQSLLKRMLQSQGGIINIEEELGAEKSTELGSNDTEEMVNVLSSMEAVNILSSGGAAASVSPTDVFPAAGVPNVSGSFPTVSVIFTTASVVTPYTRRSRGITIGSSQPIRIPIKGAKDKGKEKMIETEVPKKRKLQEQIDAQVDREMEEEFARENQRLHAEEELTIMIEGLDRSNEVIAKHLSEYERAEANLSVGEKIELIRELVKYQDHHAKILKYQTKQSKPLSKKEQREFYMSVLRIHFEDFVPMSLKEESERVKRQGLKIDQGSSKRMKISEGASEEELKGMMHLVPLEEAYIEALQQFNREDLHQLWTLVKETFSTKQATRDKEKELWIELKRLFEPDFKDQLWTHHQAFMHDPLDWKLYDTCGVHHVSTKDQEIFMLVEKDYPVVC
nr:hypothetical protein [Tanacetum cinerariifolium]